MRLLIAYPVPISCLERLAREGSQLPNPHLLMHPFITREAVLSSKIEGTQATLGEILAANVWFLN
jgi:hypothetical protein